MTNFDFSSQRQAPDYSQFLQAIGQYAQAKRPLNTVLESLQPAIDQYIKKQKEDAQQKQIVDWLNKQAQGAAPQQQTQNVLGKQNVPIASYDQGTNQTTPAMTPGNPQLQQLFSGLAQAPASIRNQALPKIFEQGFKGNSGGKPQGAYYVDPNDATHVSLVEFPGSIKIATSQADAGGKVLGAASGKAKNAALSGRTEAWNRSIDNKQIDYIAKSVGWTPGTISKLQQTSARAGRGLEILSDPNVTWQKLHAAGIDFSGIMQGGAPFVGEVMNAQFPNWHEYAARWETFINGDNPANVPPEIQQQMRQLLQGVAETDYKFIRAGNKFNKTMIGPTIRGGFSPAQNKAMQGIEGAMTGGNGQGNQNDPLGILQ